MPGADCRTTTPPPARLRPLCALLAAIGPAQPAAAATFNFTDFQATAPVPGPATWGPMALGLLGVVTATRRRGHAHA